MTSLELQLDIFGGETPAQAARRPAVSAPRHPAERPVQLALLADDEYDQWAGQGTLVDAAGVTARIGGLLAVGRLEPVRCRRCHRWLSDPASVTAGIGPVCAERAHTELVGRPGDPPATAATDPLL